MSPCAECALKDRVRRRVGLNIELLEQPWVRSLFEGFCAWQELPKAALNMTSRIDHYAVFFAEIDRSCGGPQELNQKRLFEIFGAEGLRRAFLPVSFLSQRLAFEWKASALEDMTELRRIHEHQKTWRERTWATELQRYIDDLWRRTSPTLRTKTVRMYQVAAANFVDACDVLTLCAITQAHLERHLKRHPSQVTNLSPFMRYLRQLWGVKLQPPKKTPRSRSTKDRTLIARVQSLTQRLEAVSEPRSARALIAALVAALYQVQLTEVLALSSQEVTDKNGALVLWPATHDIRIDGRLAELFRRWLLIPPANGLLFIGRNRLQPLSDHAVRYHLQVSRTLI